MMRALLAILVSLTLVSCIKTQDDGIVDVAFIGASDDSFDSGVRLSYAAQHVRAATAQGLVAATVGGEIVPALAERWIVTDNGRSYIFRIREFDLPGGSRLTAQSVRDGLRRNVARLGGTSMALDLARLRDIRAMTGRVVEIRLKSPMPGFLRLLTQPEMGLQLDPANAGPMSLVREGDAALLNAMPPESRGLPSQPDWEEGISPIRVVGAAPQDAVTGFNNGDFELVLGGTLADLPFAADTDGLTRATVRMDSAIGLFGLDVVRAEGFLSEPLNREALSLALDREALIQPFNLAGWIATNRLVSPGVPASLEGDGAQRAERWEDLDMEERRSRAAGRVSAWVSAENQEIALRVFLPAGAGSDILFEALRSQYSEVGIELARADEASEADLVLRDRVARFGGARWFLNQFNCEVSTAICSDDADFLVQLAVDSADAQEAASYLAEAETTLTQLNPFIPIGAPIRWSMVRAGIDAFGENPWNVHPLFPLSGAPI
jgi:ABC-type transport system substrate-binding protein